MRSLFSKTRDGVARAGQLLRRGEARRARADHRHRAPGAPLGPHRRDPALVPAAPDDLPLDLLDRDRILVDAEHARLLAGRRADAAR